MTATLARAPSVEIAPDHVTLLGRILRGAIAARASDVHLRVGVPPIVRMAGELVPFEHPALEMHQVESIAHILAERGGLARERATQRQVELSVDLEDVGRFRVHLYRQRGARAVVLRHIPNPIPDLASLRLPPAIKPISLERSGLVVITGATGNGKSTTIASMLQHLNQNARRHVVTLEEPIEFLLEDERCTFSQREVGVDVGSISEGITSALREDPDVIVVGEARTSEEIDLALSAAETGVLVIMTMHASDTLEAIQRIVHSYPSDFRSVARDRVAATLVAVIAQKLLPVRGGERERVLVTEVLRSFGMVRECIREPARFRTLPQVLDQAASEYGTHSFDALLLQLVRSRVIDVEVARGAARNPKDIVRALTLSR
ncbi:MAG: PilT/PilU family type 4a pilus ATPase [Sandaracinus sp.]|nr:PilT/PilU family type 4a pilus ATPase [Sandaracinus sp.]MCB9632483.1 PilT/PilU family type 4a pilus ATPase [Sandaracinus sp.]